MPENNGPDSHRQRLPRPPVFRALLAQSAMLFVVVAVTWPVDHEVAESLLLGGLVFLVPHAWFTRHAFRYQGAQAAPLMVKSFYRGEAGKFLLTAALFIAVFVLNGSLNVVAFFGSFAVMSLTSVILLSRITRV